MKVCSLCSESKELSFFHKRKASPDGLNACCKNCRAIRRKTYQSQREYNKKKYWEDPHQSYERKEKWYKENPNKKVEHRRSYRAKNLSSVRLGESIKSANRRTRVPPWLTEEHKQHIRNFYTLRDDVRTITGEEYHVDHIVPLQGKNVCGLHVPWNLQILPSDLNLSKHNKQGFSANTGEGQL